MEITVILCTHNRCKSLPTALESIAVAVVPESIEWEVLVVDNNSNDQTRTVVEHFCAQYPRRFRYLFEPRPGKSWALNAGIRDSNAIILAFMDDDVIVEQGWLTNLTMPLLRGDYAGAGGRILPNPPFTPPAWLLLEHPYEMGGILALFDQGDQAKDLIEPPFGTNMAFRKAVFEKYGGFRTDLGPQPGSQIRNEDTEFGRRLINAGERLRYEPEAVVYHDVPENRLQKSYFQAFWFDHGRAAIREMKPRPDIWGIPRRYLTLSKIGCLFIARTLRWITDFQCNRRFYYKLCVWMTAGQIFELYDDCSGTSMANKRCASSSRLG